MGDVAQRPRRASKAVPGVQDRALTVIEAPDEVVEVDAVRLILDALVRPLGLRVGDLASDRGGLVVEERLIQAVRYALADGRDDARAGQPDARACVPPCRTG
jgi:hypothetical protein